MDSEPFFLVDEELIEIENILADLDFRLKNPDLEKNQMILRTFTKACIKLYKKEPSLPPPIPTIKPSIKPKPIKIKEIKRTPKKKRIFPVPAPKGGKIEEFKTKTKYQKQEIERELPKTQIPLIQDRVSKKLVSLAELNDRYIIREPKIGKNEIKIIKEIIKQNPESPKEAWNLIKKQEPNLTDEQLTNIKYYIINSLFALGRLEPLFHDKEIEKISCDGTGKFITIKRDNKIIKTNIIFKDKEDLDSFLKKLAKKFEKTLDENTPTVDLVQRDHKFHLILGLHGASSKFTIKKIE